MYITFDYRCPYCGNEESRFIKRTDMDNQSCTHGDLGSWHTPSIMTRLPAGTRTTFRYADNKLKD